MSRSITVAVIIIFLVVGGIAYLNYERINQIQTALSEKESTLKDSEQLIKQQEASISRLDEQLKDNMEKDTSASETHSIDIKVEDFAKQLANYQEEIDTFREQLEETIQRSRIESQDIAQLIQEKDELETVLKEKQDQWQSKEEESQKTITLLQGKIREYESEVKTVNEKISALKEYLESESRRRNSLEQEMVRYEEEISFLRQKLALTEDDEVKVQQLSQLQSDKKQLEEEIKQNNEVLGQIQKEYQILKTNLADYEQEIIGLQEEMFVNEENKELLDDIQENLAQLREEKSKLEVLLQEKEEQWLHREKESQKSIAHLQDEVQEYRSNIKNIESETDALEKDLLEEKLNREKLVQNIAQYENQITDLKGKISNKGKTDEKIKEQLSQLEQEKLKLEALLEEKENQWQSRQEESQKSISFFQEEIRKYESNLQEIGHEVLSLRENLSQETSLKGKLQEKIEHFTTEINTLRGEVALFRETERSYQNTLDRLQSDKEMLEKQLSEKDSEFGESEYQDLLNQLTRYQDQMEELKEEIIFAKEKAHKDTVPSVQADQMQQEIESLEEVLAIKEEKWNQENKENRELISYLKNQLEKYQEEIDVVKVDSSLFREEIAAQVELQQDRFSQIKDREGQILELTSKIEKHAQKIKDYEETIERLRIKIQEQENLSYQGKQKLLDNLLFLVEERDMMQNNVNQCQTQIGKLESEIIELQNKLASLEEDNESKYYEVKSGDCLWNIARNRYDEGIAWTKIYKANQGIIENPDLIYPYQQIVLPE